MKVTAHQEKETKTGKKKDRRREKTGNQFLKKLCAALLRSFRGKHGEKMKGKAPGNWDPWEGQQPFRPNPNGVGTAPPR